MDSGVSRKYLVQQIMSASPARRVAMLYDRAISLLNEAVEAIEAGDIERRWRCNAKATEVVCQLWEALDMDQGSDIAANLGQLYEFIVRRMTDIDIGNDAQAAREVIGLLEPLRRSWHELATTQAAEAEPAAAQPDANASQVSLSA